MTGVTRRTLLLTRKIAEYREVHPRLFLNEIASDIGISYGTLKYAVKVLGIDMPPRDKGPKRVPFYLRGRKTRQQKQPSKNYLKAVAMRKADPTLTAQAIATVLGVTRERVRQILTTAGITVRQPIKPKRNCLHCPKILYPNSMGGMCNSCRKIQGTRIVRCASCNSPKMVTRTEYNRGQAPNKLRKRPQERYFCNNVCKGKWVGKHYGIGNPSHPSRVENKLPRTHCGRGHLMEGDNVYKFTDKGRPRRVCRACGALRK